MTCERRALQYESLHGQGSYLARSLHPASCPATTTDAWARFCRNVSNRGQRGARNRARKTLTDPNRHWGYISIRAVRQTLYKKIHGTAAPNERTETVIPYRIAHVYILGRVDTTTKGIGDVATAEAFLLRATRCCSAGGPGMACRGQEHASKPSAQR